MQLILLTTNASFGRRSVKEIKVVQQNLSPYRERTNLMQQHFLGFFCDFPFELYRTIDNSIALIDIPGKGSQA